MITEKPLAFTLQAAEATHGLTLAASSSVVEEARIRLPSLDYLVGLLAQQRIITCEGGDGAEGALTCVINERVLGGKTKRGRPERMSDVNEVLSVLVAAAADEMREPTRGDVLLDAFRESPNGDFTIIGRLWPARELGDEALAQFAREQMQISVRLLRSGHEEHISAAVNGRQEVTLGLGMDASLHLSAEDLMTPNSQEGAVRLIGNNIDHVYGPVISLVGMTALAQAGELVRA
jgi:hypothetical protein